MRVVQAITQGHYRHHVGGYDGNGDAGLASDSAYDSEVDVSDSAWELGKPEKFST